MLYVYISHARYLNELLVPLFRLRVRGERGVKFRLQGILDRLGPFQLSISVRQFCLVMKHGAEQTEEVDRRG